MISWSTLAADLQQHFGGDLIADSAQVPTWRGNLVVDHEKAACREFFAQVEAGLFELVTSNVVADELVSAPERVRLQFEAFLPSAHLVVPTSQALDLQQAYLHAGIVTAKWCSIALIFDYPVLIPQRFLIS